MSTPKGVFSKNNTFPNEKIGFCWTKSVQVDSQIQRKINQKMQSKMECILASIFERFWWILGAKLGWKIDLKSIKNGIEKTIEKRKAARWPKRRSKSLRGCGPGPAQAHGEGVGGEVNLSQDSKNSIETDTDR